MCGLQRRLRALRRPARFDAVLVVLVCGLGVEILACDVGVRVACDEEEVALVRYSWSGFSAASMAA